jgi:hypothetical protein
LRAVATAHRIPQVQTNDAAIIVEPRVASEADSVFLPAVCDATQRGCSVRRLAPSNRPEADLQVRISQNEGIARLSGLALEGVSVAELLHEAVVLAAEGLDADLSAVLQLTGEDDRLRIIAHHGGVEEDVGLLINGGIKSQVGYTLIAEAPVTSDDFTTETRFKPHLSIVSLGARSGIAVAFKLNGKPLGVISVWLPAAIVLADGRDIPSSDRRYSRTGDSARARGTRT